MDFQSFNKIPRLSRNCVITEKIDGTNAQVAIDEDGNLYPGSRNRWLTPENDNYGFARWCQENKDDLLTLGPGRHYGEWWGLGIRRGYGLREKRFSLFNTSRWHSMNRPLCCDVVPVLYEGLFCDEAFKCAIDLLKKNGSYAAPGYMKPEGIVIFHEHGPLFKKTIVGDESHKTKLSA